MEQSLAPVVLFVYNRLEATKATIECLKDNYDAEKTDVFFFSDNAKKESQQDNVNQVREYIHKVTGFRSICIFEAEKNKGLAKSVISGVTDVINQYGRVIVLEDDILTSKCFLRFMNGALDWKNRWNSIDWSVKEYSRYRFNPFMIYDFCKGGTDLDKMLRYQMKGKIDSWAIRWCFAQYLQSKWTVYPIHSLVNNIGTDGTGTHCDPTSVRFQRNIDNDFNFRFLNRVEIDSEIARRLKKTVDRSVTRKLKRLLRLN